MLTLYHGSRNIIEQPVFGVGNIHNDYGLAFYCTERIELAKEWAVTETENGYANQYEIDLTDLKIINLEDGDFTVLSWLAILLANRTFRVNTDAAKAREYLLGNFMPDISKADIIRGYRADDSYFSFANAFLNNAISLEKLCDVMRLGDLGIQYAIRSKKAFEQIKFINAIKADRVEFYPRRKSRADNARNFYQKAKEDIGDGTYMIDIYRQKWRQGDERLQRIIR